MKWTPPRNDGGNPVKGYVIERREKAGKKRDWTKINRDEHHRVSITVIVWFFAFVELTV